MSVHYFSSNNSRSTNERHISLAGTDHLNSKLSTNFQYVKNNHSVFLISPKTCKEIHKKNYIPGICWPFKSKWQIMLAATYIARFLPDSNNFFICIIPYTHIYFSYFLILCSYFHLLFLTLLTMKHILQFTMFCIILFQTARNITEIKDTS